MSARQHKPPQPPRQRVATAQLLVALPSYGCGVLPAGKRNARKEEASGTLVTEIRGAPQRETGKEERFKCARVLQSKTHYAAGIRR